MSNPKYGICAALEDEANRLIKESLAGVTSMSAKSDILTPWKDKDRHDREVYAAAGAPDAAILKGLYHRAYNPRSPHLNCLGGETEVLIRDVGIVPIKNLKDTTQEVLTSDGWGKAEFSSFGEQPLRKITMRRYGATKEVWATDSHRWFAWEKIPGVYLSGNRKGHLRPLFHQPTQSVEVVTADLRPQHRLVSKSAPCLITRTTPSSFGVIQGFCFGDGHRTPSRRRDERHDNGSAVNLFGEKDMAMLPYFPKPSLATNYYPDVSVDSVQVTGLPGFFKDLPSIGESVSYLYGWLAGYFAADGNVDEKGNARLNSNLVGNIKFARDLCYRLGIISSLSWDRNRNPWTLTDAVTYTLTIDKWSLSEEFFCIPEHRSRWISGTHDKRPNKREDWIVQSVGEPSEPRTVYCAVVPSTENFVLLDDLLTGNSRDGVARGSRTASSSLSVFVQENGSVHPSDRFR